MLTRLTLLALAHGIPAAALANMTFRDFAERIALAKSHREDDVLARRAFARAHSHTRRARALSFAVIARSRKAAA